MVNEEYPNRVDRALSDLMAGIWTRHSIYSSNDNSGFAAGPNEQVRSGKYRVPIGKMALRSG
jgi:hypothetical protein